MTAGWRRFAPKLPRLPRVEFGSGRSTPSAPSPVVTYYLIIGPALVLSVFGLLMGFSASAVTNIAAGDNPYVAFLRPLGIIAVSLVVAAALHLVPERWLRRSAKVVFPAALVFQVLVLSPLGASEGGNRNWIHVPGLPTLLQPSEFLKLALVLFLAWTLTHPGTDVGNKRQVAVVAGIPAFVALADVMAGQDLGTALVIVAGVAGTLWVAGVPGKWFAVGTLAALPVVGFLIARNPTRLRRILAVLPGHSPARDLSAPEQIDHALWALGSGGLWGLGPGASREKWEYLQAAHTDFILAIIGEEFGLLGTCIVLTCLGLMVWGMVRVCQHSASRFAQVVAGGTASWIAVQGLLNIMSVTALGPVVGVPLPLVSYGGSSFLFTACSVAIVASFARQDAGMRMWGRPDEASAGRDPRRAPRRRPVAPPSGHRAPAPARSADLVRPALIRTSSPILEVRP